ncbi:MAG TPA: ABC transporter permease [Gaiellaceae bacterium]
MTYVRIFWTGWFFQLKNLTRSGLFVFTSLVEPLIISTLSFYMFKAGHRPGTLFYAALGAGVLGIWSSTLFGSGGAISWQRWQGTLELLVAAPPPLIVVVVPLAIATSTIGMYSLTATLLWGKLAFGIPFHLAHPWLFAVAVPAAVVGLGLFGLLIASTFVLYRAANALANMLEFPIALVCGVMVPLSILPGWSSPIGWVLAPTWGVRAIKRAALGGDAVTPILMCLALGAVYVVLGAFFIRIMERRALQRATLSLT